MTRTLPSPVAAGPDERFGPRLWGLLLVLAGNMLIDALEVSVAVVALPAIGTDLGQPPTVTQWAMTGFAAGFGGLLLFGARVVTLLGRRRVYLAALLAFAAASALSALAQDPWLLLTTRLLKGFCAALTAPTGLAIITTTFPEGRPRSRAVSVYTLFGAGGFTAGLLLSGWLTETSWRWAFAFPAPVVLLLFACGLRLIPGEALDAPKAPSVPARGEESVPKGPSIPAGGAGSTPKGPSVPARGAESVPKGPSIPAGGTGSAQKGPSVPARGAESVPKGPSIPAGGAGSAQKGPSIPAGGAESAPKGRGELRDQPPRRRSRTTTRHFGIPAALTFLGALLTLVQGITQLPTHNWTDPAAIAPLTAAALLLLAFWQIERRSAAPLLNIGPLRSNPALLRSAAGAACLNGSYLGLLFVLTYQTQTLAGWSPLHTALALLPAAAPPALTALASGRLVAKFGAPRLIVAGAACAFAGGLLQLRPHPWPLDYPGRMLPTLLLVGAAFVLSFAALNMQAMSRLTPADRLTGSGLYQTAVQLAAVLAVALVAALLAAHAPAPGAGPAAAAAACRPALTLVAALGLLGLFVGLTGLIRTPPSSLHHGE
ncbi:MFS transporter [Streptomyces sp. GbtcB6]|uniref:MFS transporter n=1 Tax=Streptomyces sp. GbtcB6 TaxID=2824751 RepID=UPI0027E49987|nr:MFS transporter [Streptomyces sp. GbtcB6]